jgi:hypothetical protein
MQVPVKRVPIRRDPMEVILAVVGEHEIPILESVHGDRVGLDAVEATPDLMTIDDPQVEWERLARVYGRAKDTQQHHVAAVYGHPRRFEEDLRMFAGVTATAEKTRKRAVEA